MDLLLDWIAYIILYQKKDRCKIVRALVNLGIEPLLKDWILPETRIHAMDSMGHNWWIVCVSLAGIGLLAVLDDEPRAKNWLKDVIDAIPEYFEYKGSVLGHKSPNYDEKGAFYESVNYANYGLYEYLLFRLAYSECFGHYTQDDIPILQQTGQFFIHTFYPSKEKDMIVNFGDSHLYKINLNAIKFLLANKYDDARLRWIYNRYNDKYDAFDFIFYKRLRCGNEERPSEWNRSELYADIGWGMIRSSWEDDATLLAAKSGFTWNHAHADNGSFLLFHQGKPLIIDSGTCSYGREEYHRYYLQSKAHNVVLLEGRAQDPEDLYRGVQSPGQLFHLLDTNQIRYMYADVTGPTSRYFSRNYRHFLWVDDVIFIIDDLRSHEEGKKDWLLHVDGTADLIDDQTIQIKNGDAEAIVKSLYPSPISVHEHIGLADHEPDREVTYYSFRSGINKEMKFVTAIIPIRKNKDFTMPQIEILNDGELMAGVRMKQNGKITDVYLNVRADGRIMHMNSINTMNGWETDAYLTAFTYKENCSLHELHAIERCFTAYGSYIRRNGKVLFSSISKVTATWAWQEGELNIGMQGQPHIRAEIYAKENPLEIMVNGSKQDYTYENEKVKLEHITKPNSFRRPG